MMWVPALLNPPKREFFMQYKICFTCKVSKLVSEFHSNGYKDSGDKKYKPSCKDCTNNAVKQRIIKAKQDRGGCCKICGFNSFLRALEFHHLDPTQKDIEISRAKSIGLERFNKELEKCILVCANCHRGIHDGSIAI